MSYSSMAAGMIFNLLRPHGLQILTEGVNLFEAAVPPPFVGRPLSDCPIRRLTGCNLMGVSSGQGMQINPEPSYVFGPRDELFLVGEAFPRREER
ncbi:MAG: TrkA C-terminal domain-containing protein [Deltaproteobacteria bacterium]|nr:TrkA C-terminal domain-containing protein [Deltaproteobacteria bacterium]